MKLHKNEEDFRNLCIITADYIGIPEEAIKRDYYIVSMLQKLQKSDFADCCVFKGGTSLSKCYPGSIERFSEDIDLTFIPSGDLSKKQYDRSLKKVEKIMTEDYRIEIIPEERNDRNKSSFVFFDDVLLRKTKDTDSFYLEKRSLSKEYNPVGKYDFDAWKKYFDESIKKRYESLHEDLLYTNQKQNFNDALKTFDKINKIFIAIDE